MKWRVLPSRLSGTIGIPPSKSHTIRALLLAALADGTSIIRRPLLHGDGASARGAAESLGAKIEGRGSDLAVTGIGGRFDKGQEYFDMGNSGTGTNLFMAAAALGARRRTFDGDDSLRTRPFRPLLRALEVLGARYAVESSSGDLPFTIAGPLHGGKTTVNGISSQFLSSLLFAAPLVADATEIIVENLHERPYVELTLWWLRKQGIAFTHTDDFSNFRVTGGQSYHPFDLAIPADFSGAAFPACAAAMQGATLSLAGLDFSDPQGDKGIFDVLKAMGAGISGENGTILGITGPKVLQGLTVDLNAMPDALPALAVAACRARGETRFINVAQARIKETDRIAVMKEELSRMGARVTEQDDGLTIGHSTLRGAHVHGHGDHRVVMALALAGMVADGETVIDTAEAAAVTYPGFADDFRKLGANIEEIE